MRGRLMASTCLHASRHVTIRVPSVDYAVSAKFVEACAMLSAVGFSYVLDVNGELYDMAITETDVLKP